MHVACTVHSSTLWPGLCGSRKLGTTVRQSDLHRLKRILLLLPIRTLSLLGFCQAGQAHAEVRGHSELDVMNLFAGDPVFKNALWLISLVMTYFQVMFPWLTDLRALLLLLPSALDPSAQTQARRLSQHRIGRCFHFLKKKKEKKTQSRVGLTAGLLKVINTSAMLTKQQQDGASWCAPELQAGRLFLPAVAAAVEQHWPFSTTTNHRLSPPLRSDVARTGGTLNIFHPATNAAKCCRKVWVFVRWCWQNYTLNPQSLQTGKLFNS